MFYIPSQDLFLTLNIKDKRKGKDTRNICII